MEHPSIPVSTVSSESVIAQLPSNEAFQNIQQEYLEQWHLLENLQSDLASETHSNGRQDSAASLQNSAASSANIQDNESTSYQQDKESSNKWFVLDEDPAGASPDDPSGDNEVTTNTNNDPDTNVRQERENAKQELSPYSEQWYELDQLKASVRSLSHAAGLPQSPQALADNSDTLASGLSSGSVSTEALDEVGLEGTSALPQGDTVQSGSMLTGAAQEANNNMHQAQEDDPGDSGTSFSMDGSGAEDQDQRSQWFPLRPSAVGEDDENTSQVAYTPATQRSSSDRLQGVPHAWSDDDAKQTPPERSQPDGRDGPDLKRTPWMGRNYTSGQQTAAPPAQKVPPASGTAGSEDNGSDSSVLSQPQNGNANFTYPTHTLPLVSGTAGGKDSESDTSLLSQPLNDNGNVTPLEIITRSVPSVPKGASLISELRHRHAPHLNSDSDTESPVSKLLGPNFRAVQQVLDRMKQDRLSSEDVDDPASAQLSSREGSVQSLTSTGSQGRGTEWTLAQASSGTKTHGSSKAVTSYEMLSRPGGMLHFSHTEMHEGGIHSQDASHRSLSLNADKTSRNTWAPPSASSWTSERVSHHDQSGTTPIEATPQSVIPATTKPSKDRGSPNSTASSITSAKFAGEQYRPSSALSSERLSHRDSDHNVPPPLLQSYTYSTEQRPRSSIEMSHRSSRMAWEEQSASGGKAKEMLHHKDRSANAMRPSSAHASKERSRELSAHSSLGSSILPPRTAWTESMQMPTGPKAREVSIGDPSERMSSVIPADNLRFPSHTSPGLAHVTKMTPSVDGTLSSVAEKSHDSKRSEQGHIEDLPNVRDSDRSASSDDTDDLLTYEPVYEGDRQYLRMQKQAKRSDSKQRRANAVELPRDKMPARTTRDIENGSMMSGQEQPASILQSQTGHQGTPVDLNDSHIKALHWSLGAGTISPISFVSASQLDSQLGKSSTPLAPASEHSSVIEAGALQEQSLEENDTTALSEGQDVARLKQIESHSTTEVSSSDETYRPVLYGDVSGNRENRPDDSVVKTTPYGIYDIRQSSGPGSTNRRRKALGLQPNPAREAVSQDINGQVYISGSSTPNSMQDVRGRYMRGEDDLTGRATAYQEAHDPQYTQRSFKRSEELKKPGTFDYKQDKQVSRTRYAQEGLIGKRDFQDPYQDEYLSREDRRSERSHRSQTRVPSSKDSPASNFSLEPETGQRSHSLDRSRQPSVQYMDRTDPNGTSHSLSHSKRSASSGKSKSRHLEEGLTSLSQQTRSEEKSRSRKHHLETPVAKTGHSSREKSNQHDSKTSRLDANISKLSSLISRSLEESISSSSQTSTSSTARRPSSKGKKARISSSTSETSDVSEYFNYAYFEPRFRHSVGQKVRLRELLKSVKSRDISPIVRRSRDSTSPESTSTVSSNDGGRAERDSVPRDGREPPLRVEREPVRASAEYQRPDAVAEKQLFISKPPAAEPKCTCSRKVVPQGTSPGVNYSPGVNSSPGVNRYSRQDGNDRELRNPRKRDVAVNFPTPAATRRQSSSSDDAPRSRMEDASTQTDEVKSARKVNRKIDSELEKIPPKPVKSKRNIDEHGVISQPSPIKTDHHYIAEQREKRKTRERLIASQNSPDHSVRPGTDWRNRPQQPAWFHPLTISKPEIEQRTAMPLHSPNKSRTRDDFRVDAFDSAVNSSSSLQKLTLQEAFLYARSQFVKRSQERVARIEQAAREKERRKMIAEAVREEHRREAAEMKAKTPPASPKTKTRAKSNQVFVPKPRQMTRAEMKELNKRLYKNLPEVKAKNEEKKRLAFYRTNRLRAQLYDKRVRNRLKGAGN